MTVEEKRQKVFNYCSNTNCKKCVLPTDDWKNTTAYGCLCISVACEADLDRALEFIDEVYNVEPVTGAPEPCVLEQVSEDADTVIKIKSNRKINRLIIEYAEEVQA